MKSLFEQMKDHVSAAVEAGHEVKRWTIRTDQWPAVEREAEAAGSLEAERRLILGAPFEVAERAGTATGILAVEIGPPDAR